jgi:penicillin-binding protein 1C
MKKSTWDIRAMGRRFRQNRSARQVVYALAGIFLLFILLDVLFPLPDNIRYSQIVTAEDGTVVHAFLSVDEKWRMKTELAEINPALRRAIVYKEDRWFYWHGGVNYPAILRAAFNNIVQRRRTSGASTITMQVARLLEPRRRTVWSKIIEIFRAGQLEWRYSKDEILQMYLNLVPYGGNIEGVKSASLLYYDRLPYTLSLAQITALSIIPNRPTSLRIGMNDALLLRERNKWLYRMKRDGVFSDREIEDALAEPLDAMRYDPPRDARHFAYRMKSMFPAESIIRTNLRSAVQAKVETLAANYSRRLQFNNINNAAVIVIDNATRNVVAYLGSPDFFDREHAGQVDGVRAVRSPGSTLKPLVYALAIDRGLVTPRTVLTDVPINYDGYTPENFDQKFHGAVTVEKSLAYSLNIPAVKMLDQVGILPFVDRLKQAGFRQIRRDEKKLGLSTILGGCGVRLEELAGLYSSFANSGIYSPLHWRQGDTTSATAQIISTSASFLVTDILTQMSRPDLPHNYESSMHVPRIAWKTGTSYGRRDAWSVGYNRRYTVAVWVGNFNGEGVPELTGANTATPLLFDIFNSIDYDSQSQWFFPPKELDFRLVCSETGLPPNDYCTNLVNDYYLPTVSTNRRCTHLKEVAISADEQFSYCMTCLPPDGYKKKLYPNYPPELIALYRAEHIAFEDIPQHNPACPRILSNGAPMITSPVAGKEYILDRDEEQQILLAATTDNQVRTLYWSVNDKLYATAGAGERVFFTPPGKGSLKISCSDDRGRNTDIWIKVGYQ